MTALFLPFLCRRGGGRHDHISMITLDSHGLSLLYKQNYYQYPCSCSRSVLVWARNYAVTLNEGTGLATKGDAYIEFHSFNYFLYKFQVFRRLYLKKRQGVVLRMITLLAFLKI